MCQLKNFQYLSWFPSRETRVGNMTCLSMFIATAPSNPNIFSFWQYFTIKIDAPPWKMVKDSRVRPSTDQTIYFKIMKMDVWWRIASHYYVYEWCKWFILDILANILCAVSPYRLLCRSIFWKDENWKTKGCLVS